MAATQIETKRLLPHELEHVYDPMFDLEVLPPAQREELARHAFVGTIPVAAVVVLHLITLGGFTPFFLASRHSKLPKIREDDFSFGKAIGFLFIPIVGAQRMVDRLVDRISFQFRLRGEPSPVTRGGLRWLAYLDWCSVIPYVGYFTFFLSWLIVGPIVLVRVQRASLWLAEVDVRSPRLPNLAAARIDETKRCPRCAEDVKFEAPVCRFCGHQFESQQVAAVLEQRTLAPAAEQASRLKAVAQRANRLAQIDLWDSQRSKRRNAVSWSILLGLILALPAILMLITAVTTRSAELVLPALLMTGVAVLPGVLLWRRSDLLRRSLEQIVAKDGELYRCATCRAPLRKKAPDVCRSCGLTVGLDPAHGNPLLHDHAADR